MLPLVRQRLHVYDVQLRCSHFTFCTDIPLRIHAILRLQYWQFTGVGPSWEHSRVCCMKTFGLDHWTCARFAREDDTTCSTLSVVWLNCRVLHLKK